MLKLSIFVFFFSLPVFASELEDCANNEQARLLAQLIVNDKDQQRSTIRCNKILTKAAVEKAKKMAEFGLVTHNLDGSPNSRLEQAGYKLPKHYGREFDSNQVEAIAGGFSDAESVWHAFKRSESHRMHLLGEHEFYLEQDEIGVAMIKEWESAHVEYWVVYLTKGYQNNQSYEADMDDIPNKNMLIIQQSKNSENNTK